MQTSTISIPMEGWKVSTKIRPQIGFSGENDVVLLKIEAIPETDVTYYLDVRVLDGSKGTILLSKEDDGLTAELTEQMLGGSGVKQMQLVGYQGEQKKKSNIFETVVGESINATEELDTEYQSVLAQLSEEIAGKQDTLTAGEGISIEDGVISVSYPDGDTERY